MSTSDKKPSIVYWLGNNLYLNITTKCSNNCCFCVRQFKDGLNGFYLNLQKEPTPKEIIEDLKKVLPRKNWIEIVFCGFGEPLERLDVVLEVTRWIKRNQQIPVRVNTNGQGYLLNNGREVITELKTAGVDRVNVSLNAQDKQTYNKICKPEFDDAYESVLEFIEKAKNVMETEVTAVSVPEVNMKKVKEQAQTMGVNFRVR
ncbi:MAG: TatD family nuclease-associated radical SAM protein [Candidatus Bathyarchaeota archaeon]|nr:TatD family nuclease-associated radical SAM protein [Candidatus Bathyarchaeum sp.]